MVRTLIAIFLFLSHLSSSGQSTSFTERYNLDFKTRGNSGKWTAWNIMSMVIKEDSSVVRNDKIPMLISQHSIPGLNFPLRGEIQQRVLMPETSSESADVLLTCKSQNLSMGMLVVAGLNASEDVLYSDTLLISGKEDWYTFSMPVSMKDVEFLHFNIEVEGKGKNLEQQLYLDVLNIKIGNKDIDDFPMRKLDAVRIVNKEQVVPLSFSNPELYKNIPELKAHKIIALGETLHGSESINRAAFQLLKHQAQNNQTNLIIMELPLEETLSYNRFIQGDENFHIDSLMNGFNKLFSPKLFREFLLSLKEHNSTVEDSGKVWFLGMDIDPITQGSAMSLFDYVYKINLGIKNPVLDSVCRQLFKSNPYQGVLDILDRNEKAKVLFGTQEYRIFEHSLKMQAKAGGSTKSRLNNRDQYMFENSMYLIDLLSSPDNTVAMYAHLGHVGYLDLAMGDINHQAVGSLLRGAFADDYFSVSLVAEKGFFLSADPKPASSPSILEVPPINSLESLFDETDGDYFYAPVSAVSGSLAAMRELGSTFRKDQFSTGLPKNRIGALVFVRNSTAVSFDKKPKSINELLLERIYRNSKMIAIKKKLE